MERRSRSRKQYVTWNCAKRRTVNPYSHSTPRETVGCYKRNRGSEDSGLVANRRATIITSPYAIISGSNLFQKVVIYREGRKKSIRKKTETTEPRVKSWQRISEDTWLWAVSSQLEKAERHHLLGYPVKIWQSISLIPINGKDKSVLHLSY